MRKDKKSPSFSFKRLPASHICIGKRKEKNNKIIYIPRLWSLGAPYCHLLWALGFGLWSLSWVSLLRPYLTRFCASGQDKNNKETLKKLFFTCQFVCSMVVVEHIMDTPQFHHNPTMQYSLLRPCVVMPMIVLELLANPLHRFQLVSFWGLHRGADVPPWQLDMVLLRKPAALTKSTLRTNRPPLKKTIKIGF